MSYFIPCPTLIFELVDKPLSAATAHSGARILCSPCCKKLFETESPGARRGGATAVSFRDFRPERLKPCPATKLSIKSRGKIRKTAADAYSSIALCLRRITIIARTTIAKTPDIIRITITLSIVFSP